MKASLYTVYIIFINSIYLATTYNMLWFWQLSKRINGFLRWRLVLNLTLVYLYVKMHPVLAFWHLLNRCHLDFKKKIWYNIQHLSFYTRKNENGCEVCVVSHISTCKHCIIPWGATNSEPNHTITWLVKKLLCLASCIPARELPIQQNNLYKPTQ